MDAVAVLNIPAAVTREQLEAHFEDEQFGGGRIKYLLYPFHEEQGVCTAIIAFKDRNVLDAIFQPRHRIGGHKVKVQPVPQQVFHWVSVEIDPLVAAAIPNLKDFLRTMQHEIGIQCKIEFSGVSSLQGSSLQIQFAQNRLASHFRDQQERQQREMRLFDMGSPQGSSAHQTGKATGKAKAQEELVVDLPPEAKNLETGTQEKLEGQGTKSRSKPANVGSMLNGSGLGFSRQQSNVTRGTTPPQENTQNVSESEPLSQGAVGGGSAATSIIKRTPLPQNVEKYGKSLPHFSETDTARPLQNIDFSSRQKTPSDRLPKNMRESSSSAGVGNRASSPRPRGNSPKLRRDEPQRTSEETERITREAAGMSRQSVDLEGVQRSEHKPRVMSSSSQEPKDKTGSRLRTQFQNYNSSQLSRDSKSQEKRIIPQQDDNEEEETVVKQLLRDDPEDAFIPSNSHPDQRRQTSSEEVMPIDNITSQAFRSVGPGHLNNSRLNSGTQGLHTGEGTRETSQSPPDRSLLGAAQRSSRNPVDHQSRPSDEERERILQSVIQGARTGDGTRGTHQTPPDYSALDVAQRSSRSTLDNQSNTHEEEIERILRESSASNMTRTRPVMTRSGLDEDDVTISSSVRPFAPNEQQAVDELFQSSRPQQRTSGLQGLGNSGSVVNTDQHSDLSDTFARAHGGLGDYGQSSSTAEPMPGITRGSGASGSAFSPITRSRVPGFTREEPVGNIGSAFDDDDIEFTQHRGGYGGARGSSRGMQASGGYSPERSRYQSLPLHFNDDIFDEPEPVLVDKVVYDYMRGARSEQQKLLDFQDKHQVRLITDTIGAEDIVCVKLVPQHSRYKTSLEDIREAFIQYYGVVYSNVKTQKVFAHNAGQRRRLPEVIENLDANYKNEVLITVDRGNKSATLVGRQEAISATAGVLEQHLSTIYQ